MSDLQRQVGNQILQQLLKSHFIQPKLAISNPDDPKEREADNVAHAIMRKAAGAPCSCSHDGEMCEECQQKQSQPAIQRRASAPSAPSHVPRIVSDVLRSPGRPLDASTRAFFEPRFGQDFSHVRVHTGPEAAASARIIQAHAYTAGSHVVFDSGMYSPASSHGRGLLAHELAHVVQQGESTGDRPAIDRSFPENPDLVIHRQPSATLTIPGEIQDTPKDQEHWRQRVDAAVRTLFALSDAGLTASNVKFLDEKQFAAQFPAGDVVNTLTYIFWADGGDISTIPGKIVNSYLGIGPFDSRLLPNPRTHMDMVHDLIREALKDGYFWYHFLTDPYTTISPRNLIALYIGGITEMSGPRAGRQIKMEMFNHVATASTLVHEACHFYVHGAYRDTARARKDGSKLIGGAMISKILIEGFAEYFAREVMDANAAEFGPDFEAYPLEYEQVTRLVQTLGEQLVRAAYFKGNAREIKTLMAAVDRYKVTNPDLLIP